MIDTSAILDAMFAIASNDSTPVAKAAAIDTIKAYMTETEEVARAAEAYVKANEDWKAKRDKPGSAERSALVAKTYNRLREMVE